MNEPVLLEGFGNSDLIDFNYHLDPNEFINSTIELIVKSKNGDNRVLKFCEISDLRIDDGFSGSLSGMIILDISNRQWAYARVEVHNFEQDPGITFLAQSMEIIRDEFKPI